MCLKAPLRDTESQKVKRLCFFVIPLFSHYSVARSHLQPPVTFPVELERKQPLVQKGMC